MAESSWVNLTNNLIYIFPKPPPPTRANVPHFCKTTILEEKHLQKSVLKIVERKTWFFQKNILGNHKIGNKEIPQAGSPSTPQTVIVFAQLLHENFLGNLCVFSSVKFDAFC